MQIDELKLKLYAELIKLAADSISDKDAELMYTLSSDPVIQKHLQAKISHKGLVISVKGWK